MLPHDRDQPVLMVPTCHIEGNGAAWFDDLEVVVDGELTFSVGFYSGLGPFDEGVLFLAEVGLSKEDATRIAKGIVSQ